MAGVVCGNVLITLLFISKGKCRDGKVWMNASDSSSQQTMMVIVIITIVINYRKICLFSVVNI